MKPFAKQFYKSKAWQRCRAAYIAQRRLVDGGLCESCRREPGYIVHHKIVLTPENIHNPEVALNHRYLAYECKACHDFHEGHGVGRSKPLCVFDEHGEPVDLRRS
ncbi:hypothetical protein [Pseudoflavonifractor capillosus]|uniref:hypothetical protein n=1 Tax=Pseudoflavonifractor capillosus TaxID=106588 RepID=UPI001959A8E4|nr:hypothetical protein [Pseudoflavonifractor capillosus]MBM6680078.1 hypothetical protein [Pseudoflavonifractor capillosus]